VAKAREIPGLSAEEPYASAAAQIVAVRSEELADHSRDVLDIGDIERVHDMRVATRRLRAALEVFEPCFPRKAHAAVVRQVKELADALGERRDRDVTIAMLEGFSASLSAPDRPGVQSLVASMRGEQLEANEGLAPYVTPERLAALRESLDELIPAARHATGADPEAPAEAAALAAGSEGNGAGATEHVAP
jgi:CHAD domain-containing protein